MDKKLRLSKKNKVIAGVCGGIAEAFALDATLVRIVWVVLAIFMVWVPIMIILYIICWAIMPQER